MEALTFSPGDLLLREGVEGFYAFYIEDGRVEVSVQGTILSHLGRGHIVGEMALIGDGRRSATVKAIETTRARRIEAEDFKRELQASGKIVRAMLEILTGRLKKTNLLAAAAQAPRPAGEKELREMIAAFAAALPESRRPAFEAETTRATEDLLAILRKYSSN